MNAMSLDTLQEIVRSGQVNSSITSGNETSTVGPEEAAADAQPPVRGLSNDNRSVYLPVRIKRSRLQCTLDTGSDVTVVPLRINQSINQSISTNHLHKNDQWLTNKVKNNKTKIKPNE